MNVLYTGQTALAVLDYGEVLPYQEYVVPDELGAKLVQRDDFRVVKARLKTATKVDVVLPAQPDQNVKEGVSPQLS
ncbi:MAG: hypothetical protein KGL39_24235 [Patescibacteria group bacterium]|nr:hypothetical protein [Patescibacteria group bacterium]